MCELDPLLVNMLVQISEKHNLCRGHIGGLLAGAAFAYLFGPRLRIQQVDKKKKQLVNSPRLRLGGPYVVAESRELPS
jgi:hypothetical protein